MDLKRWECGVPGKDNTMWAGGFFKLEVIFPDGMYCLMLSEAEPLNLHGFAEYPTKPPKCEINGPTPQSKLLGRD